MRKKIEKSKLQPVYIAGPTASGKSDFAYFLADRIESVIISADSMQIYKGLDVGTAKDSIEKRYKYNVKMVDIVPVDYDFSVAEYADMAKKYIAEAINDDKIPIVVGGTGLYFDSLLYPMNFANVAKNAEIRQELEDELEIFGNEYLFEKLRKKDPDAANILHLNDTKRVIRALEIMSITNKKWSEIHDEKPNINPIMIAFNTERSSLYERINKRVDKMIENGLINEVNSINNFTYNSMKAIGYREFEYFNGENLDEIIELIKKDTRNYAKRQLTWFRKYPFVKWFEIGDFESAISYIESKII